MTLPELQDLIRAGEGHRVEFKRETGNLRAVARAVCAFSNSDGGILAIGVDDSGRIVGVKEDAAPLQERLTSLLHSGCSVPASAKCGVVDAPAGSVHWIKVARQRGFEPMRHRGRCWVRRGRASVEPSATELQELYNAFGFVLTEDQVIPSAEEHHIDLAAFKTHLRALRLEVDKGPQPSMTDDLRNRGVIRELDGTLRPTLYGLMAFGKHPQEYPQTGNFVIRCAAYLGDDQGADVISATEARGRVDEQVRSAMGWVRTLGWREEYDGLHRTNIPLIPEDALREALVNAVVHRDYSITGSPVVLDIVRDRVLVTSPGALPNHLTVERVRAGGNPRSRNELMANALVAANMMETRGRGWLLMKRAMSDQGLPEPEIVNDTVARIVRVTLRRRAEASV